MNISHSRYSYNYSSFVEGLYTAFEGLAVDMSLFSKIKSAVRGNPVTRDYEVGKQVASAGPGLLWQVHQAVKKSTKQVDEGGREGERQGEMERERVF